MDFVSRHMLKFKALLCPVVTESMSDIARITCNFPKKNYTKDKVAYQSRSDETHLYLKRHHRHIIYLTIVSYRFVEILPFIREADALPFTEYDKTIIIMAVIGMTNKEIADMLMTDVRSIKTIRNRRQDTIEKMSSQLEAWEEAA